MYESLGSGMDYPYVWDKELGWAKTPLTYDQMLKRYPLSGWMPLCSCVRGAEPAKDALEDDGLPMCTAGTAALHLAMKINKIPWTAIITTGEPSRRKNQQKEGDVPPPAATAEAAPVAGDEAPTKQPKRVSFSKEPPASADQRNDLIRKLLPDISPPPGRSRSLPIIMRRRPRNRLTAPYVVNEHDTIRPVDGITLKWQQLSVVPTM